MKASYTQSNKDNCSICLKPFEKKILPTTIATFEPCGHKIHRNPCFNRYYLSLVEPAMGKKVDLMELVKCTVCKAKVHTVNSIKTSELIDKFRKEK